MQITKVTKDGLLKLAKEKRIFLEGNILKVISIEEEDDDFAKYIKDCQSRDKDSRRKRLEITKQVQLQNKELVAKQDENQNLMTELQHALEEAHTAKEEADTLRQAAEKDMGKALEDLDLMQKKSQFELIGSIVRVALIVIGGVGVITTLMYGLAMYTGQDTQIIGSTWSNMFGILLTNAFSIVGTIMGVKYASDKSE